MCLVLPPACQDSLSSELNSLTNSACALLVLPLLPCPVLPCGTRLPVGDNVARVADESTEADSPVFRARLGQLVHHLTHAAIIQHAMFARICHVACGGGNMLARLRNSSGVSLARRRLALGFFFAGRSIFGT